MNPLLLAWVAAGLLAVFAFVAAIDGVYLHLCQLRLHARAASYVEHLWHTASAVLFVPILVLLFVLPSRGPALWLAVALVLALHVVEVLDVRSEPDSRRGLGGLSRFELGLHVVAIASRTGAFAALVLVRHLSIGWGASAGGELPAVLVRVGEALVPGAIAVAVLHVALAVRYCPLYGRCGLVASAGPR